MIDAKQETHRINGVVYILTWIRTAHALFWTLAGIQPLETAK